MIIDKSINLDNESSLSPVDKDIIECVTPSPTFKFHRRTNSGNFYLPHTPCYTWYQHNEDSSHQSYCASPISPLCLHPIISNENLCNNNETSESMVCETPIEKIKSFTFSEVNSNSPCTPEVSTSVLSTPQEKMTYKTNENSDTVLKNSDRVKLLAEESSDSTCQIV